MPRRRSLVASLALATTFLGACGTAVTLEPAPTAAAPDCGDVLQATPDILGGGERRPTTAQSTTAWGDPAITLRCGVEPPPPTTADCLSIELADGRVHDWIHTNAGAVLDQDADAGVESSWVSYGRTPAIEVMVPAELSNDAAAVLVDLSGALEATELHATCVGAAEVAEAESRSQGTGEVEGDGTEAPSDGAETPTR